MIYESNYFCIENERVELVADIPIGVSAFSDFISETRVAPRYIRPWYTWYTGDFLFRIKRIEESRHEREKNTKSL